MHVIQALKLALSDVIECRLSADNQLYQILKMAINEG